MEPTTSDPHLYTPNEEHDIREAALDETLEGTFPASDPSSTLPNPKDQGAAARRKTERQR